jgi:uncharacterized protein YukE
MLGIGALLRFAEQVVQQVTSQATQQMNVVQEQAFNPIQSTVQLVTNGSWKGVGADAFVEEVSHLHMPGITTISDQIQEMIGNLTHAAQIITQADQAANQAVQGLEEVFGQIVSF